MALAQIADVYPQPGEWVYIHVSPKWGDPAVTGVTRTVTAKVPASAPDLEFTTTGPATGVPVPEGSFWVRQPAALTTDHTIVIGADGVPSVQFSVRVVPLQSATSATTGLPLNAAQWVNHVLRDPQVDQAQWVVPAAGAPGVVDQAQWVVRPPLGTEGELDRVEWVSAPAEAYAHGVYGAAGHGVSLHVQAGSVSVAGKTNSPIVVGARAPSTPVIPTVPHQAGADITPVVQGMPPHNAGVPIVQDRRQGGGETADAPGRYYASTHPSALPRYVPDSPWYAPAASAPLDAHSGAIRDSVLASHQSATSSTVVRRAHTVNALVAHFFRSAEAPKANVVFNNLTGLDTRNALVDQAFAAVPAVPSPVVPAGHGYTSYMDYSTGLVVDLWGTQKDGQGWEYPQKPANGPAGTIPGLSAAWGGMVANIHGSSGSAPNTTGATQPGLVLPPLVHSVAELERARDGGTGTIRHPLAVCTPRVSAIDTVVGNYNQRHRGTRVTTNAHLGLSPGQRLRVKEAWMDANFAALPDGPAKEEVRAAHTYGLVVVDESDGMEVICQHGHAYQARDNSADSSHPWSTVLGAGVGETVLPVEALEVVAREPRWGLTGGSSTPAVLPPGWAHYYPYGLSPTDLDRTNTNNGEKQLYTDTQVAVTPEGLRIRMEHSPTGVTWRGTTYNYLSGMVRTTTLVVPGQRVSVQAKLPVGRYMWPAIWLLPEGGWEQAARKRDTHFEDPAGAREIDIIEVMGRADGNRASSSTHVGPASNNVTPLHNYPTIDPTVWNTYTCEIGEKDVRVLWNGQVVHQRTADFWLPAALILNVAVGSSWFGQPDGPLPTKDAYFKDVTVENMT